MFEISSAILRHDARDCARRLFGIWSVALSVCLVLSLFTWYIMK